MYFRELHTFARTSLKGYYRPALGAALLPSLLRAVMRLFPAALAGLLTVSGRMSPKALFFGENGLWVLFALLWSLVSFTVLLPVTCGAWSWFSCRLGLESRRRRFFTSVRAYGRGLYFFGMAALLKWIALLPAAAAGVFAAMAFQASAGQTEGGLWLFAGVQGLAAAFWAAIGYVRFAVSLTALPVLYLEDPGAPVLASVRTARRMLAGHYGTLARIILHRIPAMLPVVTVPFVLPYLCTEVTLFLQLRLREYRAKGDRAQIR